MPKMSLRAAALPVALVALAGCGDTNTGDTRGYTKAPLEDPGVTITVEQATEMSELGRPIRPRVVDIQARDTATDLPQRPQQPTQQ